MARFQDDEEDAAPVEKKRRRPKKKPVSDDDDDVGGPPGRRGGGPVEDEEEENSLSTGNVFLDIILDFRDDCIDWAQEHVGTAIAIGVIFLLTLILSFGLTVRYIINYLNRPTLELALTAYDFGSYAESKHYAEMVLKYAKEDDNQTRAGANFVLGAATCSIAEIAWDSNRQPYYLAAANYLQSSEEYGFIPQRRREGYFLLGKSLYLAGELVRCRAPLQNALETPPPDNAENVAPEEKLIYWYLANSYFLDSKPDYVEALRYLRLFQKNRTVTEEDRYESELLHAMILIQRGEADAAEKAVTKVPLFERFQTMRHFVDGQIAFVRARENRQKAIELESRRDPLSREEIPVAPVPVAPTSPAEPALETVPETSPDAMPETVPKDPFENPETEKLLPSQPEAAVWPVFPVSPRELNAPPHRDPWAVVTPPVPVDEEENDRVPIHRRLASLRSTATSPYAQEVAPEETPSSDDKPDEKEKKAFDPDAIIVLPTEDRKEAPVPSELPKETFTKPVPINPVREAANQFHALAEEYYRKAIGHFQEVRRREFFVPRWLRMAYLLEGICYEEMGDFPKAQELYLGVTDTFPQSSEAAAANFLWGEIERRFGRTETALRGFSRAFEILRDTPNYACPWLTKEEILRRNGEMIRNDILMKEYRQALTMLHLLRGVMPEGESARLRGETYEDWAIRLRAQATDVFGSRGDDLLRESNEKYRKSADAFEDLIRVEYDSPDYDTYLWRIAENYRLGKDFRRSIPAYRKFLQSNIKDHRPIVFLFLGEMYIHLDGIDEAIDVLEAAIEDYPNHSLVPRMRFILSRAYYERKQWDRAREMLQLNLIGEYAPSSSIYRDSIYALSKLFFEQGNWEEAIAGYESALKLHPNAIQAAEAHYCLAQAYLRRAETIAQGAEETPLDSVRQKVRQDSLLEQEKALVHIQKAEELLVKRQQAIGLTDAEQLMLRNTLFGAGSILMRLKRYERAVPMLNIAATRYQDRPEAMDALLNLATAFRHLGNREEALATLNRAEVVLNQLEKSGTIPPGNKWASLIEVQKNLVNMEEIHR